MAVLALAAVGSAIGGAAITGTVMGMSGAAFGWMAGSMAGSLLFPPKAPDGPRLEDKSVQVSTYGQPIPRVYGTHRLAGNVLWSTDLIETATEEGGKGGPSYTTYSYRASFAVGVCRGPITGIRRIWADGVLIFDQSETNTGEQKGYEAESMVIYTGTEIQLPDPTIQSYIGDTPAYRGQAYVVFTDLQLAKFGNRLPSLTFEVVCGGAVETRPSKVLIPRPAGVTGNAYVPTRDPETGFLWTAYSDGNIVVYDPVKSTVQSVINIGFTNPAAVVYCPPTRTMWISSSQVLSNQAKVISADAYAVINQFPVDAFWVSGYNPDISAVVFGSSYALERDVLYIDPINYFQTLTEINVPLIWKGLHIPEFKQFVLTGNGAFVVLPGFYYLSDTLVIPPVNAEQMTYDTRRKLVYRVADDPAGKIFVYDPESRRSYFTGLPDAAFVPVSLFYHAPTDSILTSVSSPKNMVYQLDAGTFQLIRSIPVLDAIDFFGFEEDGVFEDRVYAGTVAGLVVIHLGSVLPKSPQSLADVVTAESGLVGLPPSDLDVSALTSTMVRGFAVASGGAVRSGIEQLMMAYAFDAVESGGVVKFVRRGGAVVATLDDTDLAAHQPGNEVPTPLALTRAEEVELPQRITIRTMD